MRTVPVRTAVADEKSIAPYEDARKIIKSKDPISLSDCVCVVQYRGLPNSAVIGASLAACAHPPVPRMHSASGNEPESDCKVPPERCGFMKPSKEFESSFRWEGPARTKPGAAPELP